mmetsp:Transcript_9944/g.29240  ORF Transcript_9944/g.29240 Transcript_9944/m.29240 type:complete len:218 (+) Transcript_9944:2429-3082(+)
MGPYHPTCAIRYLYTLRAVSKFPARTSSAAPSRTVRHTWSMRSSLSGASSWRAPPRLPRFSSSRSARKSRFSLYPQHSRPTRSTCAARSKAPRSSSSLANSTQPWPEQGCMRQTCSKSCRASPMRFSRFARSASSNTRRQCTLGGRIAQHASAKSRASSRLPNCFSCRCTRLNESFVYGDSFSSARFCASGSAAAPPPPPAPRMAMSPCPCGWPPCM